MAGICIVAGSAAGGAVITVAAGSQPGLVLGIFVLAGTAGAALAVKARVVYQIIPVPALAYLAAAVAAGLIHDRDAGTSRTVLAIGAAQWIARGFPVMAAATGLTLLVTLVRWAGTRRGPRDFLYRPPATQPGGPRRTPAAPRGSVPRSREPGTGARSAATPPRRRSGGPEA